MQLLLLVLGLLPLSVHCCTAATCCSKDTSLLLNGDVSGRVYDYDCTTANSVEEFSVCITQRNSLQYLLGCANNEQSYWYISVPEGGGLDNDIHSSITSYNYAEDGRIAITSKELLRNVASSRVCENYLDLNLAAIFNKCPFQDAQTFLNCLCCERVEDHHIQQLHDCLSAHNPRYANPAALAMPADWMCLGVCERAPVKRNNQSKCPAGTFVDAAANGAKVCRYWRSNKGAYTPTRLRARAYADDGADEDEDEVAVAELDPAQFSDFPDVTWSVTPATAPAMARTASARPLVTTGLSAAFAEGTGTQAHFATRETSPPASSAPAAADGDGPDSAGAVSQDANRALLGSALVLVGVLYQVA